MSVVDQTTNYCTLISITRTDGAWIGITDLDTDVYDGATRYVSASGYESSNLDTNDRLGVANADISGLFSAAGIELTQATYGAYDNAEVIIDLYDYENNVKIKRLATGWWGELKAEQGRYVAEFRSLAQELNNTVCRTIAATCDAEFCDSRCTLDAATYTVTGSVTVATSQTVFTDTSRTEADDTFRYGVLTITRGENAGQSRDVKHSTAAGVITLYRPLSYPLAVGDEYSLIEGCDKTIADCITRSNQLNFRGFPFVPSPDVAFKINKK